MSLKTVSGFMVLFLLGIGFIFPIQSANAQSNPACPDRTLPIQIGDQAVLVFESGIRIDYQGGIDYQEGMTSESDWINHRSLFRITGDPTCSDGFWIWEIDWQGRRAWIPGGNGAYFWIISLESWVSQADDICPDNSAPVQSGSQATITNVNGIQAVYGEDVTNLIPYGSTIEITNDPLCVSGIRMWEITWMGEPWIIHEGNSTESWIQPYTETRDFSNATYNLPCEGRDLNGCYHGAEPRLAKVIFINGINNTVNDSEVGRIMVDGFFPASIPVMGIYNGGLTSNFGNTRILSAATRNLRDYLIEYGCEVTLVGHSQGGAIIADATRNLSSECLDVLKIVTFGSPAVEFPDIENISHCSFAMDIVTL